MDLADFGPRPRTVRCRHCNRVIKVKKTGRLPVYCGSSCKQQMFYRLHPKQPKPKQPKVSLEERVAQRVYRLLLDTNVITPVDPPKHKPEGEQ
jgi:phage FluMu protein Com